MAFRPKRAVDVETETPTCLYSAGVMPPPALPTEIDRYVGPCVMAAFILGATADVEAGVRRPPELHRISQIDRYVGPCVMAAFILGATAVGQGLIGSVLKDPVTICFQVAVSTLACLFLWLVGAVDPGTVPWSNDEPPAEEQDPHTTFSTSTRDRVDEQGNTVTDRWCKTCMLWRPPRASHCSKCNRCFYRFDHHCPVMGTCIAQENTRFFIGFLGLSSAAAACAAIQGMASISALFSAAGGDAAVVWTNPLTLFIMAYTGSMAFATVSVGIFFCGHLGMLVLSRTTKEAVRGQSNAAPPKQCGNSCDDVDAICCSPCRTRYGYDTAGAGELTNGGVGVERSVEMRGGARDAGGDRQLPGRTRNE